MPTPLPSQSILNGSSSPTTSQMQTALGSLYSYLAGLLGTTGAAVDARTAMSAAALGANSDITSMSALATLTHQPAITTAQSSVQLNTPNGYGSSNTAYRRFTNVVVNQGSDITYADSATLGATFTINTNGVYSISYNDQFNALNYIAIAYGLGGASTSGLTSVPVTLAAANILAVGSTPASNAPGAASTTVYLAAGACIRANAGGGAAGANPSLTQFTITRVS